MDTEPTTDKLAINVANSWRFLSVRWMGVVSVLAGVWLAMPKEMQDTLLSHVPVPPWVLPIISFVVGYYFRVRPQDLPAPVAAAKSIEAPQPPVEVPAPFSSPTRPQ